MASNFNLPSKRTLSPSSIMMPGGKEFIRDVSTGNWFSPLQPIAPTAPTGTKPRQWAYPVGANLAWTPKGDSPISYAVLRELARTWDLLRVNIQRKKKQICSVDFEIRAKRQPGESQLDYKARGADDKTVKELNKFFAKPDGFHSWRKWLGMWVEDMIVLDATALYLARDTKGKIASVHPLDGATINRLLTDEGITPMPPSPAYQQVIYGLPSNNFTTDDLVFGISNEITDRRYGYSYVEQILNTISFGLRRQAWQISEYTAGNIPEALVFMPADLPIQRIKEAQDWFDSILAGDLNNRRRLRFLPGYGSGDQAKPNIVFPKEPLLKDELDVWFAQIVCAVLGLSAQPFLKQMNRASSEEANDAAEQEGLKPDVQYVEGEVNTVLECMGFGDNYECVAKQHREQDVLKQAQADDLLVGKVYTINESREARGEDPRPEPEADMLGTFTANGFVPIGQAPVAAQSGDGEDEGDSAPAAKPQQKVLRFSKADKKKELARSY